MCHIKRRKETLERDASIHNCKTRNKNIGSQVQKNIHNSRENVYESQEIDFLYML